ncbi:MAG: class A beta-lactamase [Mycolicibacterium sp.]|uniref:class A beta-lactamase n=1 Tax=Mycolicibacterium sp. TaxID=2320850 RepID=UPI003D139FB0
MRAGSTVSRRHLLLCGVSLVTLAACSATSSPSGESVDPKPPVPPTDARIEGMERQYGLTIGLSATDLRSGRRLAHRADERFAMCSTFKAYAAAAVLRSSERGELALTDTVAIEPDDILAHSPVTERQVGSSMTLADLCRAALQQSDNAAANALLRVLGGPWAITEFARSIGDEESRLDRWEPELNSAVPGDLRDTTTPAAIGLGFRNLLAGDALELSGRQQLEDWMRGNETSSMRAGLPAGWTTADKTGGGAYGTTNDVGIAYGLDGQRLLLSIMTKSAVADPSAPNLRPVIAELAALAVADLSQQR